MTPQIQDNGAVARSPGSASTGLESGKLARELGRFALIAAMAFLTHRFRRQDRRRCAAEAALVYRKVSVVDSAKKARPEDYDAAATPDCDPTTSLRR